jgi:hypothetical protein
VSFSIVFYKKIYHFNYINNLLRNIILIVNSGRRILRKFVNLENFESELSQWSSGVEYAVGRQTKRLFDVVFALCLLFLTLPLFIIVTVEPLAKFIDRVIFPPLEGASLSPSVKPEPA